MNRLENLPQVIPKGPSVLDEILKPKGDEAMPKPRQLELKQLPSHLRYAFLGEDSSFLVIINSALNDVKEERLLRVLRKHKGTIGWTISDIKGISPSTCMHKILMKKDTSSLPTPQKRLNPAMQEVVC